MVKRYARRAKKVYKRFKRRMRRSYRKRSKGYGFRAFRRGAHSLRPAKRYGGLFPKSKYVTLRWTQVYNMPSPTLGPLMQVRIFAANNAWDPDITGAGYAAKGYQFYAKYYNHAQVVASKMNLRVCQQTGTPMKPVVLMSKLDDDATYFNTADYRTWTTDPYCQYKFLTTSPLGGAKTPYQLTHYFNAKSFFGHREMSSTGSASLARPTEQAFFVVAIESMDLNTIPPPQTIFVSIDYKIRFTERKDEIAWNGVPVTPPAPLAGEGEPIPVDPISDGPEADEPVTGDPELVPPGTIS